MPNITKQTAASFVDSKSVELRTQENHCLGWAKSMGVSRANKQDSWVASFLLILSTARLKNKVHT